MRSVYELRAGEAREIERRLCQPRVETDKIVSRKFGKVAKLLWPFKTAAHLAALAGADERTAWRWLAGEYEPPAIVIAAVIVEITKRE
jgi:hypothetical protein